MGDEWGLGRAQCWSGGGVVRGVSARCCCSKGRKWGVSCQWGPPGWQVSMRQAQFCWWAPWVLREEELGRGGRGAGPPTPGGVTSSRSIGP